ncbi:TAXI family TRAP transporter solute-binding subunit [Leucobacter chromiireducens]|uniref:TAXI family TRAP transporter solute-binding subunit n=1 Tax=Leucobacter chromiireducens TaxID=283877 RepID=UPI000F63BE44|nr:TAXI family TRAP transporter solute-binding subunit [Leucobacter chromiireducens]
MFTHSRSTRVALSIAGLALAAASLTACGGQQPRGEAGSSSDSAGAAAGSCEAPAGQLKVATGNSTGVYYVLGGAITNLLSAETPLRATASETGASVQNIEQLVNGDYDVAFSLADTAADAATGGGVFDGPQPIEALGVIHSNYTQVVVRKGAGISSLEDMRGKTVSTGSPKSGTEVIALRLLESAGLDPTVDVNSQRLDLSTSIDGLVNGSLDAVFWSGGLPTPNLTELFTANADTVEFIDITPALPKMADLNPAYTAGTIAAETYGLAADVPTIVVANMLLVRDDFDDETACAIDRTVWSNIDALAKVHSSATELDAERALDTDPVPLNAGAKRALEELAGE